MEDFLVFLKEHKMPVPKDFRERSRRVLVVDDDDSVTHEDLIRKVTALVGADG